MFTRNRHRLLASLAVLFATGCGTVEGPAAASVAMARPHTPEPVVAQPGAVRDSPTIELEKLPRFDKILKEVVRRQVVFVGETHDQYAHHLVQLAVIEAMYEAHPNLVLGVEFFQQPYQAHLDAFIQGLIGEEELLDRTEYFDRWRYDYRLYRPILLYAREHRIPIIGLNVPSELTAQVSRAGLQSLDPEQRAMLPDPLPEVDPDYRERLQEIFSQHPGASQKDFERFVEAQMVWDVAMAERAARYLEHNPQRPMVILAGSGHIAYPGSMPDRLGQRLEIASAVVVSGLEAGLAGGPVDFVVLPEPHPLPPKGQLGIYMEAADEGVKIQSFVEGSTAREAGLREGDRILSVGGRPAQRVEDVMLSLLGNQPGDTVTVEVLRDSWFGTEQNLAFQVKLGG